MDNRTKALLARIFPVLFFLGLIGPKDSYVSFHCNQALLQFLLGIAGSILGYIPFIGWILSGVISLFSLYCWIVGIVSVARGQMRPLPFIGQFNLIA